MIQYLFHRFQGHGGRLLLTKTQCRERHRNGHIADIGKDAIANHVLEKGHMFRLIKNLLYLVDRDRYHQARAGAL